MVFYCVPQVLVTDWVVNPKYGFWGFSITFFVAYVYNFPKTKLQPPKKIIIMKKSLNQLQILKTQFFSPVCLFHQELNPRKSNIKYLILSLIVETRDHFHFDIIEKKEALTFATFAISHIFWVKDMQKHILRKLETSSPLQEFF